MAGTKGITITSYPRKPHAQAAVKLTKWLKKNWGVECYANALQWDIDLVMRGQHDDSLEGIINLEVRNWSGLCPYSNIQVAQRKIESLKSRPNAYYFAISSDFMWAHYCCVEDIIECPDYDTPVSGTSRPETFYSVPKESFYLVQLK